MVVLMGLPNETIEPDSVLGDMLVSIDYCEGYNPIVTFVWEINFNLADKKPLATCLSIEYDETAVPKNTRREWLFEYLAQPRPFKGKHLRGESNDPLAIQAMAFEQINTIREWQKTHEHSANHAGHGPSGAAVHRTP